MDLHGEKLRRFSFALHKIAATVGLALSTILLPGADMPGVISAQPSPGYGEPKAPGGMLAQDDAYLRRYANGAGPSAIFRFGRHQDRDVFGVVDPVAWRIQFFTLRDWATEGASPLSERIEWKGSCALDPRLRIWRIHTFVDKVVLQLQPEPTAKEVQSPKLMPFRRVILSATAQDVSAVATAAPTPIDLLPEKSCGDSDAAPKPFTTQDSASEVRGGQTQVFKVRRLGSNAGGAPIFQQEIAISHKGAFLASVQEVEPATSVNSGQAMRHFLLTTRSGVTPGVIRSSLVLIRRSASKNLDRRMVIDLGLARVKSGQRFVAISSVGEVLTIGASQKDNFLIHACHFSQNGGPESCSVPPDEDSLSVPPAVQPADAPVDSTDPQSLWQKGFAYLEQTYQVDADQLSPGCRLIDVCKVGGVDYRWSTLTELRLRHGTYTLTGAPYAQSPRVQPREGGISEAGKLAFPGPVLAAQRVDTEQHPYLVGDIENSSSGEPQHQGKATLFGIDCSALVNALWTHLSIMKDKSTRGYRNDANAGIVRRVEGLHRLKSGDAIVINLEGTINHIVVFRESRQAGPADTSRGVLVLESSSSCSGVCMTLYDESFFDGWAPIRDAVGGSAQGLEKVPASLGDWKKLAKPL